MQCGQNLVFDVGLHNGNDTAYYLHKGFSVVAIDANPVMVERASRRFHGALASGRLTLINAGIAREAGEQNFYVSERNSEWSSFDQQNATKGGSRSSTIKVACTPFREILETSGVPYYLKIDIEGNDSLCLEALDPETLPEFVSLEMSLKRGDEDIRFLDSIGYTKFKCIRQNDLVEFTPQNIAGKLAFRRQASRPGFFGKVLRTYRTYRAKVFPPRDADWTFPPGSSGRFGHDLVSRWISVEETLLLWKSLHEIDQELAAGGLGDWFDIHATQP